MSIAPSARIHSTAIISPHVEIADNVEVGAFAVLDGKIRIGPDCVIRPGAYLFGDITMGRGNQVFSGAVLGEKPQSIRYNNEPTNLVIGDGNVFREHCTIHRGTTAAMTTRIGNNNFLMASSHVAHDCVVGNRCIFANGALLAGHCVVEDNVFLSGNIAIQQFVRVGRLAMLGGGGLSTKDIPPFIIQQSYNVVVGINVVGMRRAGVSTEQIAAVRRAYHILFRERRVFPSALETMEKEMGHVDVIQEMLVFLKKCPKGINSTEHRFHSDAA